MSPGLTAIQILRDALDLAVAEYRKDVARTRKAEMASLYESVGNWRAKPHGTIVSSKKHGYWTLMVCDTPPEYEPDESIQPNGMVKIMSFGVNDDVDREIRPEIVERYHVIWDRHIAEDIEASRVIGRDL